MTAVTPGTAHPAPASPSIVQASDVPFALNSLEAMFDWSKGAGKKNAARITFSKLPKAAVTRPQDSATQSGDAELEFDERFANADLATKVFLFLQAAQDCKKKVPELIAREARELNAVEFARLMSAVEESGGIWDAERYFVFRYSSGSVGSVWLAGTEVYNSIWKNF